MSSMSKFPKELAASSQEYQAAQEEISQLTAILSSIPLKSAWPFANPVDSTLR